MVDRWQGARGQVIVRPAMGTLTSLRPVFLFRFPAIESTRRPGRRSEAVPASFSPVKQPLWLTLTNSRFRTRFLFFIDLRNGRNIPASQPAKKRPSQIAAPSPFFSPR